MNKDKPKAFTDKIFADMAGAMSAGLCYLGHKTGLFQAMSHKGPLLLTQLISETGLQARYINSSVDKLEPKCKFDLITVFDCVHDFGRVTNKTSRIR